MLDMKHWICSKESITRTRTMIARHNHYHATGYARGKVSQVCLRDIRDLNYVKANPDIFSDRLKCTFLKVDLLRVIMAISGGDIQSKAIVYTDFDIPPIPNEKLFDRETMRQMDGLVLAKGPDHSFFILENSNDVMKEAIKEVVIDRNLKLARFAAVNPSIVPTRSTVLGVHFDICGGPLEREYKKRNGLSSYTIYEKKVNQPPIKGGWIMYR